MRHQLEGKVFGRWTVVNFSHINKKRLAVWNCICNCGNKGQTTSTLLVSGESKSCGCLQREVMSLLIPKNFKDLSNERFGLLTVLYRDLSATSSNTKWICRCDCGEVKSIDRGNLITGRQISCGCENRKKAKETNKTHGLSRTPLYRVWAGMITRCYNKNRDTYKYYGGRGIQVSDKWKIDFLSFKEDMGDEYKNGLQLDRIDVNGNYCKENCRWVTVLENSKNKRSNIFITIDGQTKIVKDWAVIFKISYAKALERIHRGEIDHKIIFFGRYNKEIMIRGFNK